MGVGAGLVLETLYFGVVGQQHFLRTLGDMRLDSVLGISALHGLIAGFPALGHS